MSGDGITCPSCASGNRQGAKFCGECGTALVQEMACPACGSPNEPSRRFCDECGSKLHSSGSVDTAPATVRPAPRPAEAFGRGRYRVVRFLGEGARKRVYLAHDDRLQREVAVSAFKSEGLDKTAIERSRREAESMGALGDHPNIVTVYDIGEEDGELYMVSQYMAGGDLTGLLAQAEDGRLTVDEVVRLGMDVAAGLAHAHAHGVIHRDVKPHNVWLTPDGTAKLGDFGLAIAGDRSRLTAEGAMVGTVAYMSPEQGLGRAADARSDLYSLGALMYELLCGIPPFTGDGAAAVISQHVSTVPVGPTWHRPDVPKALEQLVLKLLAKNPAERYQRAEEVRTALVAISSLASAPAGPDQETERALDRLSEGAFIGRKAETKELRSAVDGAVAGRGRVVMLGGEAGIGKTRLAAEVDAYASLRGAQVLWGRCYGGEGAPAFWPWVQAIRGYVHTREPDGLRAELGSGAYDIAQLVSEVRSRLPDLPESSAHDGEHSRFRLFDSIASFLVNASRTRPLAIFIEDVHLADSASLELLQFVAREIGAARVFLLCTFRNDGIDESHPLHALQASLARERACTQMRLGPLSEREVRALLEEVAQQTLTTADELALLGAVWEESGGNPYFIEELVRHLVESGAVYERDGKWVSDAEHIRDLGIPQGIRDVVGARLARLSRDCRELLSVAAVIGPEFRLETLESVCGIPAASVLQRLEEAAAAAIVEVKPGVNLYRFSHVATRDALYEDVPPDRRVELHGRIGEALEKLHEDRIEAHLGELAHHFAAAALAGHADKAADYSWWAGEHATAMFAYDEAVTHYERALSLFDTMPDEPVRRCELLLALGDVRWRAGHRERAGRTFIEAAELAERLSLSDQYARAALGYAGGSGGFSVADKANEKLLELLRNALQTLPERDSLLRVRVMARLAVELSYTSDRVATDELSRAALEMAERIGDPRIVLLAMYSRQWSTMGPDGAAEDLEAGAEIVRLARVVGDREMEFNGHHLRLHRQLQLGDLRGVDREIRCCEKLAAELRQPAFEWQTAAFRTMRALLQGRFKEGERLAQATLAIGQRVEPEMAVVVFGAQTFLTSWATGKLREIEPGGAAFAVQYPKSAWPAAYALLVSELDEQAKTRAQFEAIARRGFGTIRRDANWLTAMACLALACNYLGDEEAGRQLYELYAPYADQLTPVLTGSVCFGSNHFFVGACAEAAGMLDAAAEHYEQSLAMNETLGAVLLHARICYRFACTLLRRGAPGDLDRAAELVERGLDHARSLGLPRETERLMAIKLDRAGLADVDVQTSIEAVALSVEQERPDIRPAAAPDGTVTIMFSDIEDSTLLTVKLGDRRWLELLGRHNEIFRRHLAEHGGYEVKSQGDGFMLAFASARRAIKCAIEVQRTLAAHRAAHPEDPLKVRIGLHTGETLRAEEDFFGKNVILAARIAAQARGNEILISSLLRELVSSTDDYEFGEERELELKGLSGRYRVAPVTWSDQAPAPGTERAFASEAASDPVPEALPFPASLALVPDAVGRESERELLRTLAHRAREGGLRLATIGGEPGIGKTELAAHAAHAAHGDGAIVLAGRCQEGGDVAYGPWAEALGQYVEHAPEEILEQHAARHAGELGRIVPQLRARLPELPSPVRTADPESERYLVFSAATDLLVQAAAATPVVLVLEDLQWAEPSTAALLERVVRDLEGSPVLALMTYRPAELGEEQPLAKLLVGPGEDVVRLRLAPLSEAEVGRLLSGVELESGSPAHELAVEVCREAGGNPSFARELLHHLVETAAVTRDEAGRWVMAEETEALTLPASLGDLVARRVAAIGPAAPDVFAAAAVLGREFQHETISSMTGQRTADVGAALRGGVERSLVGESPGRPGTFAFLHGLVERALYQALGADRRRHLHRRAAESLELGRGNAGDAAAIARHWLAAASPETAIRAVTAGLAAGRRALTELAPQEAIRWFDRALALADRHSLSDAGLRCDLLIGLGDAQRQSGDRRYRDTLIEACGIARELADGGRLARAALANNRGWASSGRVDHGRVAALEDALALATDARPATRARLLAQLGAELVYAGDLDRRRGYSDEAVAIARDLDDPRVLAYVLGRRCITIWAPETLDERLESVAELERAAARLDDPITLLGAASWRVVTSLEAADVATAEAALERKAELAERIGRPVMRWEVLFARSALAYLHGRLEEAEELAGEAAQVGRDQPDAVAIYGAQIVAIRHDQGRLPEIAEMFLAVAAKNPGLSTMRAAVAQVNAELGRAEEARAAMAEDVATGFGKVPKDNLWLTTLAAYADACVELCEEPPMSALYEQLQPFADRIATNGVNANGAVALRLGALARALGRSDDAIAHLDMAAEIHRRADAPVFLLRTRLEQARTLLARNREGDRAHATELLAVASEAAKAHGCRALGERVAALR